MTKESLNKANELLKEIENLNIIIQRLTPYEGCDVSVSINKRRGCGVFFYYSSPREAYADLIDKVSGKGTWQSNPLVFAYEYKQID